MKTRDDSAWKLCPAGVFAGVLVGALLFAACGERAPEVDGLRETRETGGPTVVVDFQHRPSARIPSPNNLLTRRDDSSPTGLRLDVSERGATDAEVEIRKTLNRRIGWGILQPITVSFDAPLDIRNIYERHRDSPPSFGDDAVYLVNVDPDSEGYGELQLLDLGRGNYPVTHAEPENSYPNDPRRSGTNLVFESVLEEDENGNGQLDPIEDTDDDGRWDRPNTLDPDGDPHNPRQFLEFYERQTDTLVMRPVEPLRSQTTYAVVLTKALRGADGDEVQSPYPAVNHTRQTDALDPLREILPERFPDRFTDRLRGVQFAWTFTTGDPTRELEAIRAGLYGEGPFSRLRDSYPPRLKLLHNAGSPDDDEPLTFNLDSVIDFIVPLFADEVGPESAGAVEEQLENVDYLVSGSFLSPYFLADSNDLGEEGADSTLRGTNPQVSDEHFDIDLRNGAARVRPAEVTFNCAVPEATENTQPPFPVVVYSHAISSTRLEMLLFAGAFAELGMATCAIDAAGHGLELPADIRDDIGGLLESLGLPNLEGVIRHNRARDVRNDGTPDSGGNYFSADLLHTRDMVRQTAIDQMQFIRILRSFRGDERWPDSVDTDDRWVQAREEILAGWDQDGDGRGEVRGDFNADGAVDFGGERAYAAFGTSLGAIQTGLLGSIEPTIRAAATNAGGGGLADIAIRSTIGAVRNNVLLPIFGPLLIGEPPVGAQNGDSNRTVLSFLAPDGGERSQVPIAVVDGIEDGDRVYLRNLARERRRVVPPHRRVSRAIVRDGHFRVQIAADALDATSRRALLGFDPANDVQSDLAGCGEDAQCGSTECPERHHCSPDGECVPVHRCLDLFDPDETDEAAVGEAYRRHTADEPERFGDRLVVEIRDEEGTLKRRITQFQFDTVHQNVVYPKGADLAALNSGRGAKRQTPEFRQFIDRAHILLERADPAAYAPHYNERPLDFPYESEPFRDGATNLLAAVTVGDQTVPVDSGLYFARAAGLVGTERGDPRYGRTQNQFLIDHYVYEGIADLDRFPGRSNSLFDPDDLDRGRFVDPDEPENETPNYDSERPLRATLETRTGVSGLRLPYLQKEGAHTFNAPRPSAPFDVATFMTNQVAWYLAASGTDLRDEPCLQKSPLECPFYDSGSYGGPALSETQ